MLSTLQQYANVISLLIIAIIAASYCIIQHSNSIYVAALRQYKKRLHPVDREIIDQVFLLNDTTNTIELLNYYTPQQEYVQHMIMVCSRAKKYFERQPHIYRVLQYKQQIFFGALSRFSFIDNGNAGAQQILQIMGTFLNEIADLNTTNELVIIGQITGGTIPDGLLQRARPPQQQVQNAKQHNDQQNVHQRAVIDTSKKILKQNKPIENSAVDSLESLSISIVKQSSHNAADKDRAIRSIRTIIANNTDDVQPYGMTESQILGIVIQKLNINGNQEAYDYFVCQLLDMQDSKGDNAICPTGRSVRLIDILAYLSDEQILPDHVIKEMALNNLRQQCELSDDKEKIYEEFRKYIDNQLLTKGIIDGKTRDEYLKWVDCV